MSPGHQLFWLAVVSIPVACISRTVIFEELLREIREYCARRSKDCNTVTLRKFFYLFTCEYCFSHYVAAFFVWLTGFRLLLEDWRGYVLSFFSVVFVANVYLNIYARLRVDLTATKTKTDLVKKEIEEKNGV